MVPGTFSAWRRLAAVKWLLLTVLEARVLLTLLSLPGHGCGLFEGTLHTKAETTRFSFGLSFKTSPKKVPKKSFLLVSLEGQPTKGSDALKIPIRL